VINGNALLTGVGAGGVMTGGVGVGVDGFADVLHAASVAMAEALRRKLRRLVKLAMTPSRV